MRQYFTGFFSALCLSVSFYLFIETNYDNIGSENKNQVVLNSDIGKTIIEGGSMKIFNKEGLEIIYIGVSGSGYIDVTNEYGQYGWSVIGKVSPEHYQ